MSVPLTRRDFLKSVSLFSLASLAGALPGEIRRPLLQDLNRPNIILVIFDAMTARNLSLYGYPRKTCPNLDRLAARSTVYHNHHSAANFTTASTASLFTGTYPWTHRAFTLSGLVRPSVRPHNLLTLFDQDYFRAGFAQNLYADLLLYQFEERIERHFSPDSFSQAGHLFYDKLFSRDAIYGLKSFDDFLLEPGEAHGSLFLSLLNDIYQQAGRQIANEQMSARHPDGLPSLGNNPIYYAIEDVLAGMRDELLQLPRPFFTYLHFFPPHDPYLPARDFRTLFADGWTPERKKRHPLSTRISEARLNEQRQYYDGYIANLDDEFGKMIDALEQDGLLDNSYLIVTSDHGEMLERGERGHANPLVFEPGIHIPLIIRAPGQQERRDIYKLTSNVDVAPTLLKIAGLEIPDWSEGQILPGFDGVQDRERSVFVVEAKTNPARAPLQTYTLALIRERYKIIRYAGYNKFEGYELFDLENDPEEIENLIDSHPMAKELQDQLNEKLVAVNKIG